MVIRIVFIFAALTLGCVRPALANALLERAVPAVGSTVATSPQVLRLRFSEAVVPHFSKVEVLDPHGHMVATAPPRAEDDDHTLVIELPQLAPGAYSVIWHATAEDTHKTEGRFSFSIGR